MKVKIKGQVTIPVIGEAMGAALSQMGYDSDVDIIKGMTIYFNVYDRESGERLGYRNKSNQEVETIYWSTPEEKHRRKVQRIRKAREAEPCSKE